MQVKEIMNANVISIGPDENVSLAARLLSRHNIGALPVCAEDGRLKGIVTDRDITLRCVAADNDAGETKVREVMTRGVISVTPDDDVREAVRTMSSEQVRRLPVTSGGHVVGMLSLGDLAQTQDFSMEASSALTDISSNVKRYGGR